MRVLKPKEDDNLRLPIKDRKNYCPHNSIEVDEAKRILECKACGIIVDPYEYVLSWARKERKDWLEIKDLKNKIKSLLEQKKLLESEVGSLKSKKRKVLLLNGGQKQVL